MTAGAMILSMIPMALGVGEVASRTRRWRRDRRPPIRYFRDVGLRANHVPAAAAGRSVRFFFDEESRATG
jgi:hypothetical protein